MSRGLNNISSYLVKADNISCQYILCVQYIKEIWLCAYYFADLVKTREIFLDNIGCLYQQRWVPNVAYDFYNPVLVAYKMVAYEKYVL